MTTPHKYTATHRKYRSETRSWCSYMAPEYIIHKLVRHAQNPFCISWEYFISPKHEKQVFLADSELFSQRF